MEQRNQRLCLDRSNALAFDYNFAKAEALWQMLGIPPSLINGLHPDIRAVVHAIAQHTVELEARCRANANEALSTRTSDILAVVNENHAAHLTHVGEMEVALRATTTIVRQLDERVANGVSVSELRNTVNSIQDGAEMQCAALREELQQWTTDLVTPAFATQLKMPAVEAKVRFMLDHERIAVAQANEFQMEHWMKRIESNTASSINVIQDEITKCRAEVRSARQLVKDLEGRVLAQTRQHVTEHSKTIFNWKDSVDATLRELHETLDVIITEKLPGVAHEIRFEGDRLVQFASKTFLSMADFDVAMKRVQQLTLDFKTSKMSLEAQTTKWSVTFDRVSDDFKLLAKKIALIPDVIQDFHDRFEWNNKQCAHRWEQKVTEMYALESDIKNLKTAIATESFDAQARMHDRELAECKTRLLELGHGWSSAVSQLQTKHATDATTLADAEPAPAYLSSEEYERLHVLYTKLTTDVMALARRYDGFLVQWDRMRRELPWMEHHAAPHFDPLSNIDYPQ
ncbi:hypothetical protein SDRG_03291 [Saprolegnia diclina VS20]|uniref:Uncharacterized protein n=1 Tax=Saprolegnia diclina (strain VS20) TaxID=1156394 RepID=T0S2C4_SAPDV|nr:hypothetical protein SDRG_03291 [Saprolegnia diclina VS20]EQC39083.1 hypothetical protein SDRG_03291 [Saprolegnia diclina VS20]|eukprot:XP_008607144.1 hypothetical protein SDRG_03291 [Saprolegnia diclina VS20]